MYKYSRTVRRRCGHVRHTSTGSEETHKNERGVKNIIKKGGEVKKGKTVENRREA